VNRTRPFRPATAPDPEPMPSWKAALLGACIGSAASCGLFVLAAWIDSMR